jgi:hypothetical protein
MTIFRFRYFPSPFAAAMCLALVGCHSPTLEESYSGPWGPPTGEVAVSLARNGAKFCGEFFQKESRTTKGEFAVACNASPSDSLPAVWVVFLVWPGIDKTVGPDYAAITRVGGPPRKESM